jgi:hypothetical protein
MLGKFALYNDGLISYINFIADLVSVNQIGGWLTLSVVGGARVSAIFCSFSKREPTVVISAGLKTPR